MKSLQSGPNKQMRAAALLALVLVSSCASVRHHFTSGLPQSQLRVLELGAVQLTVPPNTALHRVLVKQPWEWRNERALGAPMQSFIPPLLIGGDEALILTLGGGVGVYNLRTGTPRWFHTFEVGAASWPLIVDNFVYVAGMDRHLHKMRVDNGKEEWSVLLPAESTGGISTSLGFLYVTTDDESLSALDIKTGHTQWTYKRPAPSGIAYWSLRGSAYPLLNQNGDRLYAGFSDGTFVCLEASSGQTLWERNFERAGLFQDADQRAQISKDGSQVYIPLVDSDLVALKAQDGTTMFKIPSGGGATPLLDETEGSMYVTLNTGAIQKIDIKSTKVDWTREMGNGYLGAPASVGPWAIGVVSSAEGLKLLDRKTGEIIYKHRLGPGVLAPPVFDGRRLLLLSSRNQLIQLRVEDRREKVASTQ